MIVLHVARPDVPVVDRAQFADSDPNAAARGAYVVKERAPDCKFGGTVLTQGCEGGGHNDFLIFRGGAPVFSLYTAFNFFVCGVNTGLIYISSP